MDKHTQERIKKLHPIVRDEVAQIVIACDKALTGRAKIRITQGLRTFQEQNELFAMGRTKLGQKVTHAKAGQSIHNYGFAVDICLLIDQKMVSWDTAKDWDNDKISDWFECVKIFIQNGWDWGGNWKKLKDLPHFEKRGFNNWKKLSKLPLDKNGYVIV